MIDANTPLALLTLGQFLEYQKNEREKPQPPTTDLPMYLNPVQLADLIGWKLQTVYQNHHNGKIPGARKIGGRLLFDTKTIMGWIEDNAIKTKAQKVDDLVAYQPRNRNKRR